MTGFFDKTNKKSLNLTKEGGFYCVSPFFSFIGVKLLNFFETGVYLKKTLNSFKIGLLFGFFVDSFKVGS